MYYRSMYLNEIELLWDKFGSGSVVFQIVEVLHTLNNVSCRRAGFYPGKAINYNYVIKC